MSAQRRNHESERNPWRPARYEPEELADALLRGRIAGTVTSHDRHNVRWKVARLVAGDPDLQFGLTGLIGPDGPTAEEVLQMVGGEAGSTRIRSCATSPFRSTLGRCWRGARRPGGGWPRRPSAVSG